MINKQNLWFLTLFSLILVLSVYYITMPNDLLTKAVKEEEKQEEKISDVDDVDEALLQSVDQLGGVVGAFLGNGNGVVVDAVGNADDVQLIPDGVGTAHTLLAGLVLLIDGQRPGSFVVVTAVGVADNDVHLLSSSVGESGAVAGIQRNDVGQVGDLLAVVVLHQPQSGVDVTGGGRGLLNGPGSLVQIFPGQLLTGVDLGGQLLAVGRGSCVDQRTVVGDLRAILLGGVGFAVPVSGVLAVVGQAVTGSGQNDIGIVGVQGVGAAGQPAQIDGTGGHGLTGGVIAGADSDVNFVDVVAQLCHLGLDQLGQVLSAGNDDVGVLGGNELQSQLVEVRTGSFGLSGLLGDADIGFGGSLGLGSGGLAAGAQRQDQNQCHGQCKDLFHFEYLLYDFYSR